MTATYSLNKGQQAAADRYFDFLMNDASDTFVISGGPGHGKTFLMQHLVKRVMADYATACRVLGVPELYDTLSFTATTHAAAEVLEQSIGSDVNTIHSFLGLKVKENYSNGKTTLEKTKQWKVRDRYIVFIDEYSMIDTPLFELIKQSFTNSKFVFVGDHCQMAPVNEKTSPVYAAVAPENFVFLDEPVRNAGSPALSELCNQLRETVETGVFKPIKEVPGVIDYLSDEDMMEGLDFFFKDEDPSARILCYTNSRVETFNAYIREIRKLPADMVPGDVMISANTFQLGDKVINVEREFTVKAVEPTVYNAGYGAMFADGEPVQYRLAQLTNAFGLDMTLPVPANKERWLLAIKESARLKNWHDYFELKGLCIDLRAKHACTVYKSQGSTYDMVFIDIGNIGTSYDADQVARMLLVAASRARSRIFLYGQLPPCYNGG